ncbi:ThuA domain-containing protein [Rubellicoccus peritrichatus]|uniref:ThuA domain-containing protein n=1 Tax=Rubellicoccus peritrichatus TaxID=3080537 RepID=A0AAQ3L9V5_9BACT|nr:ThuA domain-containing protein [Puniceicoccus sp. CR14]WOO40614.1 ThuA domain-containing protein [Puniceicoccus sp. CR14]
MVLPKIAQALLVVTVVSSASAIDWKPTYDDKPLHEDFKKKILENVPTEPIIEPKAKRKILVYSATAGFRHGSIPTGKFAMEKMGESSSAYEAVVSDDPANFEKDALKTFDAVLLLNTTQDFFMPQHTQHHGSIRDQFTDEEWAFLKERNDRLIANLVEYVANGGGLVGVHAATDSCYGHKGYGDTIGAYFWGHPWVGNQKVMIRVEDPEHELNEPVFGDVTEFEMIEEIYQFTEEPYSREKLRILLNLDPERSEVPKSEVRRKDNDFPVAWIQKVGDGRVFYTSIGHNDHHYWDPTLLKHYLAGIQFACGDLEADTTPSAKIQVPHF